jgi:hypothetical protein
MANILPWRGFLDWQEKQYHWEASMDVHELCDADEAVRLCRDLPAWINSHRKRDSRRSCHARELDYSFNRLPTLVVEVSSSQVRIADYKCNIVAFRDGEQSWLVFSPLVVMWEKGKEERDPGWGRQIIDHSVSSIAGFAQIRMRPVPNILIASGNLTVAKAGRPFFEGLGWEIVSPAGFTHNASDGGLRKALRFVAAQIEAAIAQSAQNTVEPVAPFSFAIQKLTRSGSTG